MPEEQITPEQKEQLNTWSIQRDALLGRIAILATEEESKTKKVKELSVTVTDMENKIQQSIGRLTELDNTEKLYMEIVDSKLPELESEKSRIVTEIDHLIVQLSSLEEKKEETQKDIEFLIKVQSEVFNRTEILDKVVDHVTNVSSSNIKELDNAVITITEKVKEIIELSGVNITAHTEILNEIPKLFVELSRKTLERQKI